MYKSRTVQYYFSMMQRLSLVPETQCQSSLTELPTDEENITGLRLSSLEISVLLQFVQGFSKCDIWVTQYLPHLFT